MKLHWHTEPTHNAGRDYVDIVATPQPGCGEYWVWRTTVEQLAELLDEPGYSKLWQMLAQVKKRATALYEEAVCAAR